MKVNRMIFAGLVLIVCCRQPIESALPATTKEARFTTFVKPPSETIDTLQVEKMSAVFFQPEAQQLQKLKAAISAQAYESMLHESFYQLRNARLVLKKNFKEVTLIEGFTARWLVFKQKSGKTTIIDLDKNSEPYGIYLFNLYDDPLFIDMTNIDTQAGFYFQKEKS